MTGFVLVTGATGFIGRDLTRRLAAAGWAVRAAARNPAAAPVGRGITCVAMGDLARSVDWPGLVAGTSHVVHLAGIAHQTSAIPEAAYMAANAAAGAGLAAAARDAGVRRIVLVSSVRAATGPSAAGLVTEDAPESPVDAYGRSKLEGERLLAATLAGSATDWATLRPVLVYGTGVKGNMAALLRLARLPLPLPLGGLAGRRSLLGLVNLASAIEHALTSAAVSRRVLLAADPGPLSVGEIVAALRRARGWPPAVFTERLGLLQLLVRRAGRSDVWDRLAEDLVVSTNALEGTGWRPAETAEQGLARWVAEDASLRHP